MDLARAGHLERVLVSQDAGWYRVGEPARRPLPSLHVHPRRLPPRAPAGGPLRSRRPHAAGGQPGPPPRDGRFRIGCAPDDRAWPLRGPRPRPRRACGREGRFPEAPILIVCPWAAGGGTDRVARQLAVLLEQDLGVPGQRRQRHRRRRRDRAQPRRAGPRRTATRMTLVTIEIATLHWRGMTSISHRGLRAGRASSTATRARSSSAPTRPGGRSRDLEQAIRQAPGQLRASGTATAGIWHLALAGWLSTVGLPPTDVIWVSIAGSAPSLQELMAGGIDIVVVQPAGSAGAARRRAHPQPGRDGRGARRRSSRMSRPSRSRGSTGRWARCAGWPSPKDTPPERVARPRGRGPARGREGDAYRSGLARAGFTPAYEDPAGSPSRSSRPTSGSARSCAATRSAGSRRSGSARCSSPRRSLGALALVALGIAFAGRGGPRPATDAAEAAAAAPPGARLAVRGGPPRGSRLYVALAETVGFILTAGALLLAHSAAGHAARGGAVPLTLVARPRRVPRLRRGPARSAAARPPRLVT